MKRFLLIFISLFICVCFVACEGEGSSSSSEQTTESSAPEDITLTIVFHENGGTGVMQSLVIEGGEASALPSCTYVRNGYSFEGWATSPLGEVQFLDGISVQASSAESQTLNLYAIWAQRKTVITFEGNGGSGTMSKLELDEQASVRLPSITYTRYGYIFAGWATQKDGEVVYADEATFTADDGAKNVTLWAIWQMNATKISFDANGGDGKMGSVLVSALDSNPLPLCEFTREGYAFKGWASAPSGALAYADGGAFSAENGNHEITLYAVWERLSEQSSIVIAIDLSSAMGDLSSEGKTYFDLMQGSIAELFARQELAQGSQISVILFDESSTLALPVTVINGNKAQISAQILLAMESYFYEHTDEANPTKENRVSAQAGKIDANGYKIKSNGRNYGMAINRASSLLFAQSCIDRRVIFISCGEPSDKGLGYDVTTQTMAKAGIVTSTIMIGNAPSSELQALAKAGNGEFIQSATQGELTEALIKLTNNTKGE